MGGLSIWHWLVVLAVVLLLFGGGSKISSVMGDFAKGIKSFKKNMADDESAEAHEMRPHAGTPGSIPAPGAMPPASGASVGAGPFPRPETVRPESVPHG